MKLAHSYEVSTGLDSVSLRSTVRLPFEPKDTLLAMRDELRRGLARLEPPKPFLYARYSSSIRQLADAENVLFYNIGTAHFSGLGTERVVFERSFESSSEFPHDHLYSTSEPPLMAWTTAPPVCEWVLPYVSDSDASRLAGRLCLAMKRAPTLDYEGRSLQQPLYALKLVIEGPVVLNLLAKMKPMFDGVIAGMHGYNGRVLTEVCTRLSLMLGEAPAELAQLLARPGPLGPRELVRPYRERVQWNPADDACVRGEKSLRTGAEPRILVSLHPVQPTADEE